MSMLGKGTYRSSKDTILVLPQPDEPTRAANLPFSIYSIIRRVRFRAVEIFLPSS